MDAVSVLVHVRGTTNIVERVPCPRTCLTRGTHAVLLVAGEVVLLTVGTCLLCAGVVCRVLGEALPYAGQRVLAESRLLGGGR